MEALAIALYTVSGLVAAPVFCFCVARYAGCFPGFSRALRISSAALLAPFTMELISVGMVPGIGLVLLPAAYCCHVATTYMPRRSGMST